MSTYPILYPMPLQPGDTVGFVAPSSPLNLARLDTGIQYFHQKGFNVKLGKHLKDADRFLAGSDTDRAQDIMDFFSDPDIKAIIATAGGQGSQRLLPYLDYDVIRLNPKILTGFSDTTALQLGLWQKTGLSTYTGFTLRDTDLDGPDPLVEKTFMACLTRQPYIINEGITVTPGTVTAPLVGGNLSLMTALMGTPYQPYFKNCILLFEDVWAEPYRIDGMISQLALAGVFEQVAGIIIGEFEQCISQHEPERDGTVEAVIEDWSRYFNVPCIKNFPYGHGRRRCMMPIGHPITLNATQPQVHVHY